MKCDQCGENADYYKNSDGKDVYLCYDCAKKYCGIITLWCKRCNNCGCYLEPSSIYVVYNESEQEHYSYCSVDCAMEDIGFGVLDEDEEEDDGCDVCYDDGWSMYDHAIDDGDV